MSSVKNALRTIMEDLNNAEVKKLKHLLKDERQIRKSKLEGADSDDVVDLIVEAYTEEKAGEVLITILKKMNLNQMAEYLKKQLSGEAHCRLHKQQFELFCENDQQLVCQLCRDSRLHKDHTFIPIDKAAVHVKEELMVKLQGEMKDYEKARDDCHQIADHIKTQSKHTERQIQKVFFELHQFLRDEEAARIAALRKEEEQKSQMMKEKIEKMSREISSISDTISAIEEEMKADDVTFLQKSTAKRAQCTLQDPERLSGALINVAKHLGNLKFRVWEKMQMIVQYTPVILDPNTANNTLILSEDLTSVRLGDESQQLPDNPERFDTYTIVLGSEGFNSGTHCWDVEVGESNDWLLGVITESFQRKGNFDAMSAQWVVGCADGEYAAAAPPHEDHVLTVQQRPQRIRVQLDWDRGELTFTNPDNNTHIHTFTHTFTERVFPSSLLCQNSSQRILPVKCCISLNPHS